MIAYLLPKQKHMQCDFGLYCIQNVFKDTFSSYQIFEVTQDFKAKAIKGRAWRKIQAGYKIIKAYSPYITILEKNVFFVPFEFSEEIMKNLKPYEPKYYRFWA